MMTTTPKGVKLTPWFKPVSECLNRLVRQVLSRRPVQSLTICGPDLTSDVLPSVALHGREVNFSVAALPGHEHAGYLVDHEPREIHTVVFGDIDLAINKKARLRHTDELSDPDVRIGRRLEQVAVGER